MLKKILVTLLILITLTSGFYYLFFLRNRSTLESLPKKPNVVVVIVDDLNDWLSFLDKDTQAKTPYLDKIASESLIFDYAYAPATLCNPSRTSIMTGKSPSTTGIYNNFRTGHNLLTHLGLKSLPELFKENKYQVFGAGKIFHASHNNDGFWDSYEKWVKMVDPEKGIEYNRFLYGSITSHEELMSDKRILKWTKRVLKKELQEPFFLTVGYSHPHFPWISPKRFTDMYPLDSIKTPVIDENFEKDIPRSGYNLRPRNQELLQQIIKEGKLKDIIRAYLASVSFVDENIGKLFEALKATPYYENTIFIFMSDHGFHFGSKNTFQKTTLWEDSTHIPLLIHIPKESKIYNQHYQDPVNLIDIFPSLVELCNLKGAPKDLDGQSLVPIIKDINYKSDYSSITTQGFDNHAVRMGEWKYIHYADGNEELYNIKNDPKETTNLADKKEYQNIKEKLYLELPKKNAKEISWQFKEMIKIPSHRDIKSFWIDETEVSNLDFRLFFQKTKYRTAAEAKEKNGSLVFNPQKKPRSEDFFSYWDFAPGVNWHNLSIRKESINNFVFHPVVHVNFNDASAFCKYYEKRLPTKAEWRHASQINPNKIKDKNKWQANIFQGEFPTKNSIEDGYIGTAAVKSFKPNRYGVFDMAGNVWEWVLGDDGKAYIMGGSFLCGDHCRGFDPNRSIEMDPATSSDHIGFRCVKSD